MLQLLHKKGVKNMNEINYGEVLCRKIVESRKKASLTQEQLAEKLGITFQAVSKWENSQCCPDIAFLPKLAEIFNISIDELFGKESIVSANVKENLSKDLPWENDGKLRAVLYLGRELIMKSDERAKEFTFQYKGEALNIESNFSIECGDIQGSATAGGVINCGDIMQNSTAGASINCEDVAGDANAGCNINCADVAGNVTVGHDLNCADIDGSVLSCACNITCDDIEGDVKCSGNVQCNEINGRVI
jgi:transcriptional regulator with XRE-family HTH domain